MAAEAATAMVTRQQSSHLSPPTHHIAKIQ